MSSLAKETETERSLFAEAEPVLGNMSPFVKGLNEDLFAKTLVDGGVHPITKEKIEPTDPTLKSIAKHMYRQELRLYNIEDKIDHLLFHNYHDVNPAVQTTTPMGSAEISMTKNSGSTNNIFKREDFTKSVMTGEPSMFSYGIGPGINYPPMPMPMPMPMGMGMGVPMPMPMGVPKPMEMDDPDMMKPKKDFSPVNDFNKAQRSIYV